MRRRAVSLKVAGLDTGFLGWLVNILLLLLHQTVVWVGVAPNALHALHARWADLLFAIASRGKAASASSCTLTGVDRVIRMNTTAPLRWADPHFSIPSKDSLLLLPSFPSRVLCALGGSSAVADTIRYDSLLPH